MSGPEKPKRYRLKAMVIARLLAEMTVLLILVILPIVLFFLHRLTMMPGGVQFLLIAIAVVSLAILPCFGFITILVVAGAEGLTSIALFKRQSCAWSDIKNLTRRSTYNWLRYVVQFEGGELSFPILLKSCDELVARVRAHLPAPALIAYNPYRKFKYDPFALGIQIAQSALAVIFLSVAWFFCAGIFKSSTSTDSSIMLGFCVLCSLIFLWRTIVVLLMPRSVELTRATVVITTLFFQREYNWEDVRAVALPFPLLPEGFMLKTKRGSYLVGTGMEAGDELEQAIKLRLESRKNSERPQPEPGP